MSAPEPIPLSSAKAEHYAKLRARLAEQKASEHEAISAIDELCHDNERLALRSQASVAAALEAAARRLDNKAAVLDADALRFRGGSDANYTRKVKAITARTNASAIRALITPDQHDALAAHVAAEVAKARAEDAAKMQLFDGADWFWRPMDPDDNADNPAEVIHRAYFGQFVVCEIASSYRGPTRFGFNAPVLDPESDDEEFLHFETQEGAMEAAKARQDALAQIGAKP